MQRTSMYARVELGALAWVAWSEAVVTEGGVRLGSTAVAAFKLTKARSNSERISTFHPNGANVVSSPSDTA